ncbi:Type I restriction modification DNA specificity domain protein [Streptococcus thermophilus]|uniref:restriction endonuclease subunit S n=1 Tax=Streptococcus thermophilus TaxID=1308 RepID=UPI000DC6F134|nr:restriction endonuclease subunit S [Streptococcus thermophilus]MBW7825375.1 restriction endonuclease subunit S [Streptococcus thermophilus]MCZ0707495.1 restriction endonuclease subunit S [Streptococcus thermophilus]MDA5405522.1 restriction endonuclease subunit S [Streptococcus thermophilus]MDA5411598.1 restriction endonuclease subunit S [Streptococcus thermophilus]SSC63154.1 Type I restriction modification DNA specificity domain protein [Streptococcus thermophilus]
MMSKKVPELRFKGFTDDWEQRKLGEVGNTFTGLSGKTKEDFGHGEGKFITYVNVFNNPVADLDGLESVEIDNKQFQVKAGDVLFTTSSETPEEVGMSSMWLGNADNIYLNSFCFGYRPTIEFDNYYLAFMLRSASIRKKFQLLAQGISRYNISKNKVMEMSIPVPSIEEQQKIGAFFKQLDDTIALYQRKLDLLKEQKKGFLQKMFPKNGAKVPELRFKGFTDDWEERKLGESSDVRDGTHASPKYVSQGHPMVTSKNLTHFGLDMTDVSFLTDKDFNEINKRSKVSIGDILFGMIGTIGNPVIVDRDDFAIKNVALIKEKTSNPITNKWLLQYLKSPSFNRFIQKENAGGTQKFISLGLIRDMKLRVPEFDEQQKIGAFFKQLDDTIALHQRKLDLLKEQKKGFLQKMFV